MQSYGRQGVKRAATAAFFYFAVTTGRWLVRWYNENNKSFVEFTCRYEYLEDVNKNGNIGRFYTPMLSYVIGDDYTSKISLVGVISDYSKDIINTNQYSSKLLLLQYQIRF